MLNPVEQHWLNQPLPEDFLCVLTKKYVTDNPYFQQEEILQKILVNSGFTPKVVQVLKNYATGKIAVALYQKNVFTAKELRSINPGYDSEYAIEKHRKEWREDLQTFWQNEYLSLSPEVKKQTDESFLNWHYQKIVAEEEITPQGFYLLDSSTPEHLKVEMFKRLNDINNCQYYISTVESQHVIDVAELLSQTPVEKVDESIYYHLLSHFTAYTSCYQKISAEAQLRILQTLLEAVTQTPVAQSPEWDKNRDKILRQRISGLKKYLEIKNGVLQYESMQGYYLHKDIVGKESEFLFHCDLYHQIWETYKVSPMEAQKLWEDFLDAGIKFDGGVSNELLGLFPHFTNEFLEKYLKVYHNYRDFVGYYERNLHGKKKGVAFLMALPYNFFLDPLVNVEHSSVIMEQLTVMFAEKEHVWEIFSNLAEENPRETFYNLAQKTLLLLK